MLTVASMYTIHTLPISSGVFGQTITQMGPYLFEFVREWDVLGSCGREGIWGT